MALSVPSQSKIPTKTHDSASLGPSCLPPLGLGRAGARPVVPPVSAEAPGRRSRYARLICRHRTRRVRADPVTLRRPQCRQVLPLDRQLAERATHRGPAGESPGNRQLVSVRTC
jgi:hypothetical protein